jgi:hypothetical protein
MRSAESERVLESMVRAAGVDPDYPAAADVTRTWDVFKKFAAIPAEDLTGEPDDDGVLVSHGTYDWQDGLGPRFSLDFTRQFMYYDDGEYDHMAQLGCTFSFEPVPPLAELGSANIWSFDRPLDTFFALAEQLHGFQRIRALAAAPLRLEIELGDV